ncbi:MAG: hypothetical protein LBI60_01985 [Bacteroidales bacterium]|nr:hypothetical protein [Bacteroidales bacterium]
MSTPVTFSLLPPNEIIADHIEPVDWKVEEANPSGAPASNQPLERETGTVDDLPF